MNIDTLKISLSNIPAGQHGAVSVRGTPLEVPAFNWKVENIFGDPILTITKDDGSFVVVEVRMVDFFYTYPIPKTQPHDGKRNPSHRRG